MQQLVTLSKLSFFHFLCPIRLDSPQAKFLFQSFINFFFRQFLIYGNLIPEQNISLIGYRRKSTFFVVSKFIRRCRQVPRAPPSHRIRPDDGDADSHGEPHDKNSLRSELIFFLNFGFDREENHFF